MSKFWGHPIFIGATILLPKDYDRDSGVSYPVNYEQGHFSLDAPGGFVEAAPPRRGHDGEREESAFAGGKNSRGSGSATGFRG